MIQYGMIPWQESNLQPSDYMAPHVSLYSSEGRASDR